MTSPVPGEITGNLSRFPARCSLPSMNRPRTGSDFAPDKAPVECGLLMFISPSVSSKPRRQGEKVPIAQAKFISRSIIYRLIPLYLIEYNESNISQRRLTFLDETASALHIDRDWRRV